PPTYTLGLARARREDTYGVPRERATRATYTARRVAGLRSQAALPISRAERPPWVDIVVERPLFGSAMPPGGCPATRNVTLIVLRVAAVRAARLITFLTLAQKYPKNR